MKIIRYFNMQPGLFLQLTVLWWIRLHLLYAASKIGFGAARLLRVLLIPSDLPNGLRIYLRWNRQIEKKNLKFMFLLLFHSVWNSHNINHIGLYWFFGSNSFSTSILFARFSKFGNEYSKKIVIHVLFCFAFAVDANRIDKWILRKVCGTFMRWTRSIRGKTIFIWSN